MSKKIFVKIEVYQEGIGKTVHAALDMENLEYQYSEKQIYQFKKDDDPQLINRMIDAVFLEEEE